jgi:hypothetical protein
VNDFSTPFGPTGAAGLQGPIILYQISNIMNFIIYGFSITNTPIPLYIKTGETPSNENGIGFLRDIDHEVNITGYIQIDLADLIRLRTPKCNNPTIKIGSIQQTEGYNIYGSNTLGQIGTLLYTHTNILGLSGADSDEIVIPSFNTSNSTILGDLYKYGVTPYRYISISAVSGNVTLNLLTFYLCSC